MNHVDKVSLSNLALELVQKSINYKRNRRDSVIAIVTGIMLILVGAAFYANIQRIEADKQRRFAQEQEKQAQEERDKALYTQSLFLADLARQEIEKGNFTNATLLALEALPKDMSKPNRPYVPEAEEMLYKAIFNLSESLVLQGYQGKIQQLLFNNDTQIGILNEQKNVYLWDMTTGQLLYVLLGYHINSTTFNQDNFPFLNTVHTVFYEVKDKTSISALDIGVSVGSELLLLGELINDINRCGSVTIVTTSLLDYVVRLRDASVFGNKLVHELSGHTNMVRMAAFGAGGEFVVTASEDKTARLWHSSTGEMRQILSGHTEGVSYATFYGKLLVTVSDDNTLRLWNFSPNQQTMKTDSSDNKHSTVQFFSTQELIDYANKTVPRCLTPEQRKQFFLPESESQPFIDEGKKLAQEGDIKAATAKFKKAIELEPCHKFYPEDKARYIYANTLIKEGEKMAKNNQIDAAIIKFKEAQEVDSRFKFADSVDIYAQQLAGRSG